MIRDSGPRRLLCGRARVRTSGPKLLSEQVIQRLRGSHEAVREEDRGNELMGADAEVRFVHVSENCGGNELR